MRTKNSIRNLTVSLLFGAGLIVVNFLAQRFFVQNLGIEYLGLNGLFMNVISMLSVVELGLGAAIIYHLYSPLHDKDTKAISELMSFYKKGYRIIAAIIFSLGMLIIPILPMIIGENSLDINITFVYILFIVNTTVSYLLSYKRSILYADQKSYLINAVHGSSLIGLNIAQISVLVFTQNYYLYLVLRIASTLVENIVINHIVNKRYKFNQSPDKIGPSLRKNILQKIKGLMYHKVGEFAVIGSTNIVISVFLGIATVGLYSNYLLIQTAVNQLFLQAKNAITASIGNLLIDGEESRNFTVFKRLDFAGRLLAIFSVSIFLIASGSFIELWIGAEYVLPVNVIITLSISIFLNLTRWLAFHNFKEASGIFYEDRFVPVAESVINIVASIILVQYFGLAGVFMGAALSSLAFYAYSYPKFVYKGVLRKKYIDYARFMFKNWVVALIAVGSAFLVSSKINLENILLQLVSDLIVAVIVPAIVIWLVYRKGHEYEYYMTLMKKMISKILKQSKK